VFLSRNLYQNVPNYAYIFLKSC